MARIKQATTTITSMEEADRRLGQLREVTRKLSELEAWKEKRLEALEGEVAQRRKDRESGMDLDAMKKALEADLLAFTESKRGELTEGDRRSVELANGILGFRLGTGKVETLQSLTFKAVESNEEWMTQLRRHGWTRRPPETISKNDILDSFRAAGEEGQPQQRTVLDRLARCGLTVLQEDAPFVEPAVAQIAEAHDVLQFPIAQAA